jgi:hypothetical protein
MAKTHIFFIMPESNPIQKHLLAKPSVLAGIGLAFSWVLIFFAIDHTGEFPLIDDWAYAHGVSDLLHDGVLKISDWVAMTQVAHLFAGYTWSLIFGYSMQHLREFTILIGGIGSLIMFVGTGYFTKSIALRLAGTAILTFNPIWIYLSYTFMTDVPFTALFLGIMVLIYRWMREPNHLLWVVILFLGVTIVLIRQTGLGIGLSFLLWVVLMKPEERNKYLIAAILLAAVQVGTLMFYEIWMSTIGALSTRYHSASNLTWILSRDWWLIRVIYYGIIQLHYVSMFMIALFPISIWLLFFRDKTALPQKGLFLRYGLTALFILGIAGVIGQDILMNPRYTHLMQYDTVGHVMTIDFTYELLTFSSNYKWMWYIIFGISLVNFAALVQLGWSRMCMLSAGFRLSSDAWVWPALILGGYAVFISIGQFVFDRYMLLHLPLAIWVVLGLFERLEVRKIPGVVLGCSGVFLALSLLFGVVGTHDSMEWNRVRFGALAQLEERGVPPTKIDGGAEYNSWKRTGPMRSLEFGGKSWWYVADDEYAIAFNELPGFERIEAHPFGVWYGLKSDTIWVVQRVESGLE